MKPLNLNCIVGMHAGKVYVCGVWLHIMEHNLCKCINGACRPGICHQGMRFIPWKHALSNRIVGMHAGKLSVTRLWVKYHLKTPPKCIIGTDAGQA